MRSTLDRPWIQTFPGLPTSLAPMARPTSQLNLALSTRSSLGRWPAQIAMGTASRIGRMPIQTTARRTSLRLRSSAQPTTKFSTNQGHENSKWREELGDGVFDYVEPAAGQPRSSPKQWGLSGRHRDFRR